MAELDGWDVARIDRELAEPVDRRVDTSALMALRSALVELEASRALREAAVELHRRRMIYFDYHGPDENLENRYLREVNGAEIRCADAALAYAESVRARAAQEAAP